MTVLAFDTCFGAVSAAVHGMNEHGAWQTHDAYEPLMIGHAERLLPMVDGVMAAAGVSFQQLDRIAVTVGPGGFTGLRVGIAVARALALATGLPVVGMTSLAVMAKRAQDLLGATRGCKPLVIAVDARRGAVYMQIFDADLSLSASPPALLDIAAAVGALPTGPLIVAGSGGGLLAAAASRVDLDIVLPDLQPHARQLALLAPTLMPLQSVKPLYLRPADAKPTSQPPLSRRP